MKCLGVTPFFQVTKQHLNNSEKMRRKTRTLFCFWLSYVAFVSSAWKHIFCCHPQFSKIGHWARYLFMSHIQRDHSVLSYHQGSTALSPTQGLDTFHMLSSKHLDHSFVICCSICLEFSASPKIRHLQSTTEIKTALKTHLFIETYYF